VACRGARSSADRDALIPRDAPGRTPVLSREQPNVARRQQQKVSGNDDDFAQIVIIIRIRLDYGLETEGSWPFPVDRACRMATLRCIIRSWEDMNKGAKWADMPTVRG
jgi:hypothetical protein